MRLSHPLDAGTVRAPDGTTIRTHSHQAGHARSVLLVPPPSADVTVFRHLTEYLGSRVNLHAWDYRGMYGSSAPQTPAAVRAVDHAGDALATLDQAGASTVTLVSWSLGAEIALEIVRTAPSRVGRLVLVSPAFGAAYAKALDIPGGGPVRAATVALRSAYPAAAEARKRIGVWPETSAWLKRLGLAADTLDDELFAEVGDAFRKSDARAYLAIMKALESHAEAPRPEAIRVPTLAIVGDTDRFGSVVGARRLVRRLPLGELFVVKGGSHYAILEFPELVNLRIEKFLDTAEPG